MWLIAVSANMCQSLWVMCVLNISNFLKACQVTDSLSLCCLFCWEEMVPITCGDSGGDAGQSFFSEVMNQLHQALNEINQLFLNG